MPRTCSLKGLSDTWVELCSGSVQSSTTVASLCLVAFYMNICFTFIWWGCPICFGFSKQAKQRIACLWNHSTKFANFCAFDPPPLTSLRCHILFKDIPKRMRIGRKSGSCCELQVKKNVVMNDYLLILESETMKKKGHFLCSSATVCLSHLLYMVAEGAQHMAT